MNLPADGSELTIGESKVLSANYQPADSGPGVLRLRVTDERSYAQKEINLRLDFWSPEGFKIELWEQHGVFAICGAAGVAIVRLETLELTTSFSFEYLECESVGLPWFVKGRERFLVATETRVICIQEQGFVRWFWSIRESSKPHWKIADIPVVRETVVEVPITSFKEMARVELEAATGLSLLTPRGWIS